MKAEQEQREKEEKERLEREERERLQEQVLFSFDQAIKIIHCQSIAYGAKGVINNLAHWHSKRYPDCKIN